MRLGWGRDDGPFFFSCPGRKPHERCEPGPILLCMGLFSRFCVWAPRCTAEEALRCVRDTRSLVLRAHGESIQLQCIMLWDSDLMSTVLFGLCRVPDRPSRLTPAISTLYPL